MKGSLETQNNLLPHLSEETIASVANTPHTITDLDHPMHIRRFIHRFYQLMLNDSILGDIFVKVAKIRLEEHLPRICAYWEKMLLGKNVYRRHTMNIHRALHSKYALSAKEFNRWLALFHQVLNEGFVGPYTCRASNIAYTIANNMQQRLVKYQQAGWQPLPTDPAVRSSDSLYCIRTRD